MNFFNLQHRMNRRRALSIGGGAVGSFIAGSSLSLRPAAAQSVDVAAVAPPGHDTIHGTIKEIEEIIGAQGSVSDGVFSIEIDRDDIPNVTLRGVPIKPAFEINGSLNFQSIGGGRAATNSDMCLKPSEVDSFIDQLLLHNIDFQAEHQHFYDFSPIVFFIHFRATGDPIQIARAIKAALNVTSTPFPQTLPKNPTTPLPADELGKIIGAKPSIGADGVVTFQVPRAEPLTLGGIRINPYLNVSMPIGFQPYGGGRNAAAVPDFGMIATEIRSLMRTMRGRAWDIGCLYNQETDEFPQLYFSHQFKVGDSIELAHEIRAGLEHLNVVLM